jgi:hypothetical protein
MTAVRRLPRAARSEGGWSVIELLAAMAIFMFVIGGALSVLETFTVGIERNQRRNDTQQHARVAIDRLARELRNLASPTVDQPQAVDKAEAYDLVFQTVDPIGPNAGTNTANVRRVRYCLDASDPRSETVWQQVQTWTSTATPALPSTGSCPDADTRWTGKRVAAANVVNRINAQDRPLFNYNASTRGDISFVRAGLWIDTRPGTAPGETTLGTGVFLRNQNRAPTAAFTATLTGNRHMLLNGSASSDPEGQPLTYSWYDGSTLVGTGITYDYLAPATGSRPMTLKVTDAGGLQAQAPSQTVVVQ